MTWVLGYLALAFGLGWALLLWAVWMERKSHGTARAAWREASARYEAALQKARLERDEAEATVLAMERARGPLQEENTRLTAQNRELTRRLAALGWRKG